MSVVKHRLLSAALALLLLVSASQSSFAQESTSPVLEKPVTLSPGAMQLAEQLGIAGRIKQLDDLHRAQADGKALDIVQAKQAIMQAVLVAMLQVRATSAQIAYDVFEAGQVRTLLEAKRDRVIKLNTIANFISGGVSELAGGAFQLDPNSIPLDNAGNIVEMVGGAAQMSLSALALRQQNGSKRNTAGRANMLAPIFDQSTNEDSKYPSIVWAYLNAPVSSGTQSRRQALIKQWLEYGRLASKDPAYISALTGGGGRRTYSATIDLLEDRQALLTDVNAMVSRLDRFLLEILLYTDLQTVS